MRRQCGADKMEMGMGMGTRLCWRGWRDAGVGRECGRNGCMSGSELHVSWLWRDDHAMLAGWTVYDGMSSERRGLLAPAASVGNRTRRGEIIQRQICSIGLLKSRYPLVGTGKLQSR